MQVEYPTARLTLRRRRTTRWRLAALRALAALAVVALLGLVVGIVFAGSPQRIAGGVTIDGVDVGGLSAREARERLERQAAALRNAPVTLHAAGKTWSITPSELGVSVDWNTAVAQALREGDGFGPVRGYERLRTRLFGTEVDAPVRLLEGTLAYRVGRIAAAVDQPHRDATLRLRGLQPVIVSERDGRRLDRELAAARITSALGSFERVPLTLPVRTDPARVSEADLAPIAAQVRTALSAPVRLAYGTTRWRLPRWRIAEMLALPAPGERALAIDGPGDDRYFARLRRLVETPARDAEFAVEGSSVRVVPGAAGLAVDVRKTKAALLDAALSRTNRVARLAVASVAPARTTAEARAMGITDVVGSYETHYGGIANRIHNVQLVSRLIDGALIAPGATFSFNGTTGERTAEKGFREAPVIINGELQTGLGGGVCQVSTTVFNAAYEAGLDITSRTNHALYISHYPLGRDATVNYPDLDLRFVNDTPKWLLLRTFVGSSSLVVNLYGTPTNRRVESETAPLRVTSGAPVRLVRDPTLPAGKRVVDDAGEPGRATSVRRIVYGADGKVLHEDTWSSYYRAEPQIVRVGTKPKAKPKKKAAEPAPVATDSKAKTPTESGSPLLP